VDQFVRTGIAGEASRDCLMAARGRVERRSGLWFVEAAILAGAYFIAYSWLVQGAGRLPEGAWFGSLADGKLHLTYAGWWGLLVALPLFWFLLGRWLWRFVVWGLLLRDIAHCDLRLVATHPDRCGGLAFIGTYPHTYTLFVLAMSTVASATVLKAIVFEGAGLHSFRFALLGMVLFLLIVFALPLVVFSPRLARLKRQGLSDYGALASRHNLDFEAKWIAHPDAGREALGSADVSSLADLAAGYELVNAMRVIPLTMQGLLPLVVAAVIPLALVAATQVPFAQVLQAVKKLLLV
jgi:hypothetical protein